KSKNIIHSVRIQLKMILSLILGHYLFYFMANRNSKLSTFLSNLGSIETFYSWLGDSYSRDLLIKLLSRKILSGSSHLPPLMNVQYEREAYEQANQLLKSSTSISVLTTETQLPLSLFDLDAVGYTISAELHQMNVASTFILEQYRY